MVNSYGTGPQVSYAAPADAAIKPAFARGQRRRMNLAAICFSLFVPWVLFSVIYAVFSFSLHYRQPAICYFIAFLGLLVVAAFGYLAFYAKNWQDAREPGREPSWFVFLFVTSLVAWLAASHQTNVLIAAIFQKSEPLFVRNLKMWQHPTPGKPQQNATFLRELDVDTSQYTQPVCINDGSSYRGQ